ncbi:hypothetical protein sos41_14400 [Alphaproteobacteria bacterium SO-S41]|nr:hypothetical protein sos41_14400 [Alphaproteobacteria bacterium SO-S41]
MAVRAATADDVAAMVTLVEASRERLQEWQPVFWRRAPGAAEMSRMFFGFLVGAAEHLTLVHENDGAVDGFLIASETKAPPVVAPGGPTWTIDDFCVASDAQWETAGRELLDAAREDLKQRGAVQVVVVCPAALQAKQYLLEDAGLAMASQWWTAPL